MNEQETKFKFHNIFLSHCIVAKKKQLVQFFFREKYIKKPWSKIT